MITIDDWLIASADDDGAVKVFKLNSLFYQFLANLNLFQSKIWDYRRKTASMESTSDCADYISDLAVSKDKKILLATRLVQLFLII